MSKKSIPGVPRYFETYVCDCFQNALAAQLKFLGQKPEIILADYLSLMYDENTGYIGVNYLFKPNTTVEFSEEELNTSLEFVYLPVPEYYNSDKESKSFSDRIRVNMYMEKGEHEAFLHIKGLIDNDIPAIAAVDLFFMPYHRAFQKEHGLHYIVITGYDEDEQCFELFDKYKLSSSDFDGRLSFKQISLARSSDNPQRNAILGEYKRPLQNIWAKSLIDKDFNVNEVKTINILKESCNRLGGRKKVLDNKCGLEMLDCLIKDLLNKKIEGIDQRSQFLFRTYYNESFKTIARSRMRFNAFLKEITGLIPQSLLDEISQDLNCSSKYWDISANISLKLAITKSLALVDNMCEQIALIKKAESRAVEKLETFLSNNT